MTDESEVVPRGKRRRTSRARTAVSSTSQKSQPSGRPMVRQVVLRNRRGQMLQPSVLNDDGTAQTVRLSPFQRSAPVYEDRITDYTRQLAAQGHLSIDATR